MYFCRALGHTASGQREIDLGGGQLQLQEWLSTEAQPIRLEYAMPTCAVWSQNPHSSNHIALVADLPHAPAGVRAAGTPMAPTPTRHNTLGECKVGLVPP
jgi:hypothetical protein